jgi:hypothetical protein
MVTFDHKFKIQIFFVNNKVNNVLIISIEILLLLLIV